LQYTFETLAKTPKKILESHCKYMQHPDKILATYDETLKTYASNMHIMQHLDETLESYI
jgi:hypothetical protein